MNDAKYIMDETATHVISRKIDVDDETKTILNDIAMSLRVMSGRSKVTNANNKNTYKDFYFAQSSEDSRD